MGCKEYKVVKKQAFLGRKQCPNNSQTTLKKLRKSPEIDFFDPQNGQISKVNLAKKCRFLSPFSTYELYFWIFCDEKKNKIVYPNSSTHLKKKKTPDFSKKLTEIDFFDPQNGQNSKVNLAKKCRFLTPFSIYELYFWIFCVEKKFKIVPPYSLKEFKKKKKKYTRF